MSPDSGVLVIRAWRDEAGRILARISMTTDVASMAVREQAMSSAKSLHTLLDQFLAHLDSTGSDEIRPPNLVARIGSPPEGGRWEQVDFLATAPENDSYSDEGPG